MDDLLENQKKAEPPKASRMSLDEIEKGFQDLIEELRQWDIKSS